MISLFTNTDFWMTLSVWLCIYGLFCMFCFLIVMPPFFLFWIIPKIERRYGAKLVFNFYGGVAFQNWVLPAQEISFYIFFKYIGWNWPNRNKRFALKKIDYKIETASKAELVMSFLHVFLVITMIVSPAIGIPIGNNLKDKQAVIEHTTTTSYH